MIGETEAGTEVGVKATTGFKLCKVRRTDIEFIVTTSKTLDTISPGQRTAPLSILSPLVVNSGDNQYRCNNSNNSDYYDYENEPHQSSGASSGDHHQISETYDEQGDRFNYNDGYDCHSFASEKDHQKRSARSANSSSDVSLRTPRRLSGGHSDDGDQTLRPGNYLLVTWDTEILPGGGLYQLAILSSHGDSLHCVVEQRAREEDLHQAKHHPNFPLVIVILSGIFCL